MGKISRKPLLIFSLLFFCLLTVLMYQRFSEKRSYLTIETGGEIYPKNPVFNAPIDYLDILKKINLSPHTNLSLVRHAMFSGAGLAITDDKDVFINWIPEGELAFKQGSIIDNSLGDVLYWWKFEDLDANNTQEFMAEFGIAGSSFTHPFHLYSYNNGKFTLLLKLIKASSKTEVKDLNNDGQKEIIHQFSLSGSGAFDKATLRWKDIWRLKDGNPVKVNNEFPEQYPELLDIYKEPLLSEEQKFFHPVFLCLKEKVESNINGILADSEDCANILHRQYEEVFTKIGQK